MTTLDLARMRPSPIIAVAAPSALTPVHQRLVAPGIGLQPLYCLPHH